MEELAGFLPDASAKRCYDTTKQLIDQAVGDLGAIAAKKEIEEINGKVDQNIRWLNSYIEKKDVGKREGEIAREKDREERRERRERKREKRELRKQRGRRRESSSLPSHSFLLLSYSSSSQIPFHSRSRSETTYGEIR
jgi:hypothetical protein